MVIPTLNRRADLERCLGAVGRQTTRPGTVVVVDNGSTDGSRELLASQQDLIAVLPPHNVGGPGGFGLGIGRAVEAGGRWVWLLDDDAAPARDALELLLYRLAAEQRPGGVGGVVPTVAFGDGRREAGWLWGAGAPGGRGQSPNVPSTAGEAPAPEVDWAPFAGLLLSAAAYEAVGPIHPDIVLWHADVELCLRMRAQGWRLLCAPRAQVHHPAMPLISRRTLGRRFTVGRISPGREYYDTRDRAILRVTLADSELGPDLPLPRRLAAELGRAGATLAADRAGLRRVAMRALGALDGLTGRTDRRPKL